MTRHETSFEPTTAADQQILPAGLVPPQLANDPAPTLVSASRMIAAVIYGHSGDAHLREAGTFILAAVNRMASQVHNGPETGAFKLGLRKHKPGKKSKAGSEPPMIVILEGSRYVRSTGVRCPHGQDFRTNTVALAKLADYRYGRAIADLNVVCAPAITIADIVDEWTRDWEPKTGHMKGVTGDRYAQMCDAGTQITPLVGHHPYAGPIAGIGIEYANLRTAQDRGNCSPDNPNPGKVKVATARHELKCLRQMINYHAEKHNKSVKLIKLPPEETRGLMWINWYQFMQFLLACRGFHFDEEGNLIRDLVTADDGKTKWAPRRLTREEIDEFEMVERFAMLMWYGLRHAKALPMRWNFAHDFGYFDFVNGLVVRSAQDMPIHNKRAAPSRMDSLERSARRWKAKDDARNFKHVIHHADGSPRIASMQQPFMKVARNAGLPWLRPKHLKHSAVTAAAYAGMPIPAICEKFSTSYKTLMKHYTHLQSFWTLGSVREWRPENVGLKALKASSPLPSSGYPRVGGRLPPR